MLSLLDSNPVRAAKAVLHPGQLRPNNSFKPNLLRYTKAMAEKACHGFGSTTQLGLTQALGRRVNCMGKFLSRWVAFRLSLGLLMSFARAQLRDFLALRLPSHQSIADRIIGVATVLSLGFFRMGRACVR